MSEKAGQWKSLNGGATQTTATDGAPSCQWRTPALAAQNAGRGGAFPRTQVWHTNKGGPVANTTKLETEECPKQLLIPRMTS